LQSTFKDLDHKLAIVLAAVLDGERPDGGVVQPRVALMVQHLGWYPSDGALGSNPLNL
jgi:hypothetical protein